MTQHASDKFLELVEKNQLDFPAAGFGAWGVETTRESSRGLHNRGRIARVYSVEMAIARLHTRHSHMSPKQQQQAAAAAAAAAAGPLIEAFSAFF